MADGRITVVSACDAGFFTHALGLVLSIRAQDPSWPIILLDLGLLPEQRALLSSLVTRLIIPGWDIDGVDERHAPGWFRAMTSRPYLPDYATGYDVIIWIDSDAWVQSQASLILLAEAARAGQLAIIEEDYRHLAPFCFQDAAGRQQSFSLDEAAIRAGNAQAYAAFLQPAEAEEMAALPTLNSGVFALRTASAGWRLWREQLKILVARGGGLNKLIEQLALSLVLYRGAIPMTRLGLEHNFVITHQRPQWDRARRRLIVPHTGAEIGILHLTDLKAVPALTLPLWEESGEIERPLGYLAGLS